MSSGETGKQIVAYNEAMKTLPFLCLWATLLVTGCSSPSTEKTKTVELMGKPQVGQRIYYNGQWWTIIEVSDNSGSRLAVTHYCKLERRDDETTIRVPLLSGGTIDVPRSQAHKITPIGWAMLLDRDRDKKETWQLFEEACQKNPKLASQVSDLFASKGKIERAQQRQRRVR